MIFWLLLPKTLAYTARVFFQNYIVNFLTLFYKKAFLGFVSEMPLRPLIRAFIEVLFTALCFDAFTCRRSVAIW